MTTEPKVDIIKPDPDEKPKLPATRDIPANVAVSFETSDGFVLAQRVANAFARSDLVPDIYRNNISNCLIALDMARRIDASPLMTMQNLYIVHGRPSWSSVFLIAAFNTCGRFTAIRYEWRGMAGKDDWSCRALCTEKATGEPIEGSWITWSMVKSEGWIEKRGSKWKTMPEQMFKYRAATFLIRSVAPELTMGLHTQDEVDDFVGARTVEVDEVIVPPQVTQEALDKAERDLSEHDAGILDDEGGDP